MSSTVLADRDINAAAQQQLDEKPEVKSMDYHRKMLQNKIEESQGNQTYVSPSDNIMSPCTAKLSSYKSKNFGKAKPKSLFAKTSSKNLGAGDAMFGDKIPSPQAGEDKAMGGQ